MKRFLHNQLISTLTGQRLGLHLLLPRNFIVFIIGFFALSAFSLNGFATKTNFSTATVNSAQTICSGNAPAQLTLSITTCNGGSGGGSYSLTYQWQESDDNGATDLWANAVGGTGATTNAYTPPVLSVSKYYRCVMGVTQPSTTCGEQSGTYTTASVKITVNATPTAGITNNTGSTVITCTTTAISVTATGGSTYAWSGGATPSTAANSLSAAGTYTVTVTSSGCNATSSIAITANNTTPTITLGSNPSVTQGTTTADLTYSATTGTPNQYSVNYDATAEGQGFSDVAYTTLPSTPIVLTVPAGANTGAYNATLTVKNSTTGCVSGNYSITVTITAGATSPLAAWDFTGAGPYTTLAATTFNANLSSSNLITRGAGAASSAGANSFRTVGFQNNGISTSNTDYFQITLGPNSGYAMSLSTIDAKFAGTATFYASPGVTSQFAYSLDGTNFTLIGSPVQSTSLTMTQIDISGISALQNIAAGTTVTIRYYASGQTTTGGWGFYSSASGSNGLEIGGTMSAAGPNITVTPSTLTGFTYMLGSGPSAEQTFTVSGSNLTNDISIAATTNYEISKTSGSGYTTPLTFTQSGGTVASTTVYVRLKSGLSVGTYNSENITASSTGATNKTVTCSGTVTAVTPTLTATPSTLTGFTYVFGSGPSTVQSFALTGANLNGTNVTLTTSANYEISTSNSPFAATSPITLTAYNGTSTTIYVRLKAGLAVNTYNSENVVIAGGGATSINETNSGSVTAAAANSLKISQIYGGGGNTGATYKYDFVELFNPTCATINLSGYSLQYTSAAGSGWGTAPSPASLSGSVEPSKYFLIKLATGGSVGAELPTADLDLSSGGINMSATTGKVALVCNTTALSGTCPTGGAIVDFVGFGTSANCYEGTSYAPAPSATKSVFRANGGCTDTDQNSTDLIAANVSPRNSSSAANTYCACATKPEPTNHPTVFTCGTTTSYTIPLTWTDAAPGTQSPDGYLIKWGLSAPTGPTDGTAEADGATTHNVLYGVQNYTATGLTANTVYYFKIWSYTNSGTSINYKTDGTIQQTNCMTQVGPCLAEGFEAGIAGLSGWLNGGCLTITTGACEGSKKIGFDASADFIVTPAIVNPIELTFQYDKSSNTDPWSLKVQWCATQGGTFADLATISNATTSCQTATVDLSAFSSQTIYIKFLDTRASGTAQRYIDDVNVYCASVCTEPTTISSSMTFTSVTNSSMVLGWTSGNGANRIIVAREGSAVNFTPVDGTSYTSNADFSQATDLGNGNKIIYKGSSNLVSLSGLNVGTTYYFTIFEFNCSFGMEDYLTSSSLTGSQATAITPNPVTDLQVTCLTNSTATIAWTAPEGSYDGVIIGMRKDPSLDCHTISGNENTYTANPVFGSGTQYGGTTPYSFVVYKGTGTSVTVTGLTASEAYQIKAYAYKNSTYWATSTPTTAISSLALSDPLNAALSPGNATMLMTFVAPTCADDVMIVCKQGTFTAAAPSGDGTAYSASLTFGSGTGFDGGYVVYKGSTSPQTVTNLVNGTNYCFKFFTRKGTEWSAGSVICETPLAGVTQLLPGGIAVMGVNSNIYSTPAHCISGATSGDDEISIVTFQDITPGTTLDMTDNGWEKCFAGQWGNQEGYMRIKRTTSTIPAGTIITFRLTQGAGAHFTGLYPDNNWTIDIENGPLIFNSNGDQLYFMQGGTWHQGTLNTNNATYTGGTFLFAFNTNSTWTSGICTPDNNTSGTGRSQNSGLLQGLECFNMVPNVATDYLKYVGDMSQKTQRDWISYLKDGDNWSSYTDCQTYYAGTPDYLNTTHTILITTVPINYLPGIWTGQGGNTDWFYCGNWDNLRVPDKTVNVELPATGVTNSCNIGSPPSPYTEASCLSIINNLTGSYVFSIDNAASKLDVWGNFTNNFTFNHTAGLVTFKGTSAQSISANASYIPTFYNMTLNNNAGLTLNTNININNNITLTNGILTTGTNVIELLGSTSTITETAINPSSYVTGNVKVTRNIGGSVNQTFGGVGLEINEASAANSTVVTRVTGTTIIVGGNSSIKRYFDITPTTNSGFNAGMVFHYFDHEITWLPFTEADLVLFKAPSPAYSSWSLENGTVSAAANTSSKSGIPSFSRWTLADKNHPLPVELLGFEAVCGDKKVELAWTTSSETNNDYFTIEKSFDTETWTVVGTIKGAGNSNTLINYKFTDPDNAESNTYYRLKQTDYDGEFVTCDPIEVNCDATYHAINVYPNPATGQTICYVYTEEQGEVNVEITNSMGTIVYSNEFSLISGFNLLTLDLTKFQSGFYYVIIHSSDGNVLGYKRLVIN